MSEKSRRNYPFIGRIYTAEQIDNMIGGLDPSNYYNKDDIDSMLDIIETAIDAKQDELTAGDNITIENNVISAVGGDESDWVLADNNTVNSCFTINNDGLLECVRDVLFITKGILNDNKYLIGNSALIPKGFVAKTTTNQYTSIVTCENTLLNDSSTISIFKVIVQKQPNQIPSVGSMSYNIKFAIDNNAISITKTTDIQTGNLGYYGFVAYVKN